VPMARVRGCGLFCAVWGTFFFSGWHGGRSGTTNVESEDQLWKFEC